MGRRELSLIVCLFAISLSGCDWLPASLRPVPKPTQNDSFTGEVQAVFLYPETPSDNFRDMKLLTKFGYLDPHGTYWEVPAGYVTDGASIPWYLWPAFGGPYNGPYRDAAVLHDYYCEKQTRTWEQTHEMFFNASRRRGVSETKAKTMYLGLQMFGWKWPPPTNSASGVGLAPMVQARMTMTPQIASGSRVLIQAPDNTPGTRIPTTEEQQIFEELKAWIERENPSLAEIQKKVEEVRAARNLPVLSAPPPE